MLYFFFLTTPTVPRTKRSWSSTSTRMDGKISSRAKVLDWQLYTSVTDRSSSRHDKEDSQNVRYVYDQTVHQSIDLSIERALVVSEVVFPVLLCRNASFRHVSFSVCLIGGENWRSVCRCREWHLIGLELFRCWTVEIKLNATGLTSSHYLCIEAFGTAAAYMMWDKAGRNRVENTAYGSAIQTIENCSRHMGGGESVMALQVRNAWKGFTREGSFFRLRHLEI